MSPPDAVPADVLLIHATIVTVDARRRILIDGAIAWRDGRILAVGKTAEVAPTVNAAEVIDASHFVITPGLINAHVHITGEPVTRGLVPDDLSWRENVFDWLIPLYNVQTEAEERLAAQLAAAEMLRNGVTSFIEAGTIRHLDAVADALRETGIRGRIGQWTEDRAFSPDQDQAAMTTAAVRQIHGQMERLAASKDDLIAAWPSLIGHMLASDDLWREAAALAERYDCGITAHMSPAEADPEWYLANTGHRPIEHLAELGVLGPRLSLTHVVHIDESEARLLARSGTGVNHCPMSAFKGGYGVTGCGRFPEMAADGVPIALGTDGNNNGNTGDLHRAMFLAAGLFKDARRDTTLFPAHQVLEMATLNGARAMGLADRIGSLEVGKKADLVLHDIDRPEWRPLMNVVNQLVWSADGRSAHTVFVDGVKVVEAYRCLRLDEAALYAQAEIAGPAIAARAGLANPGVWPVE